MHKTTPKMKMARKMLTQAEISKGTSPFNGAKFRSRAFAIKKREYAKAKVNQK